MQTLRRRLLALSSRRVAPGGESGPLRWLVPALVVCVLALGGQQIVQANGESRAALDTSLLAQDVSGDLAEYGTVVAEVAAADRATPAAADRLAASRKRVIEGLTLLIGRAPQDQQLRRVGRTVRVANRALRPVLADLRAGRSAEAAAAARTDVTPPLQRAMLLSRAAADAAAANATAYGSRARDRALKLLGGGLVAVCLLLWTFVARRKAEQRHHEHRFRSLVQNSSDLILVVDRHGVVSDVTPASERLLGRAPEDVAGLSFGDLVHEEDRGRVQAARDGVAAWRAAHADGSWIDVESTCTDLLEDASVRGLVLSIRDVSERKSFEQQLQHQAFHDALTGLPNRTLFEDRVGQALARAQRSGRPMAVLFIDLDDFKTVNDSLGHAEGDALLRLTSARLDESLRGMDTAARLGGDEFAVLAEDVEDVEGMEGLAIRLHEALERPFLLGEQEVFVRASIGIAVSFGTEGADELMRNADTAMYVAKAAGKGRHEIFRPTMHVDATRRLQLSGDLRRAVRDGEFVVAYQPLVALKDGRVLGAEALVRWNHPEHGLVPPDDFIPLAEETGLISQIGEFVLTEACNQAAQWHRADASAPAYVSVNLSTRQFRPAGKIVEDVKRITGETGLDPSRLMLEITETVLMQDMDSIGRDLQALRALGVRIAIDDFGTGYSALSYLREFPIDIVKMDRSFVQELGRARGDDALVRSVLEMGEALEMDIIAEGIEHGSQLDSLRSMSCGIGQGYYFSRPLSATEIAAFVAGIPPVVPRS
jgi:diguanylate cyclase (GGDEF)-like protein/PAS domain S-box-containing protein